MKLLGLHLWREWREHRMALLLIALVLPLLAWGIARVPPKKALADPLIQSGAALAFVVVLLVSTGGELLGAERRGTGLRWLERLPRGLGAAFAAKLIFLALTTALAAVYGLGVARSLAHLRGVEPRPIRWEPFSLSLVVLPIVVWTFACSAWALRGGLALLAATAVLALTGFPAWRVLSEGYRHDAIELGTAAALLLAGGLASAMLAFLRGGRFGRGTGVATFLGLAPAVPLLALSTAWSLDRLALRERIDPLAPGLAIHSTWVSEDGRTALVGCSMWNRHWDPPSHVLRVDLETGAWERVGGRNARFEKLDADVERGPLAPESGVWVGSDEDPAEARFFAASDASPIPLEQAVEHLHGWVITPAGLGWIVWRGPFRPLPVVYDPFRKTSTPLDQLGGMAYVGREQWLVAKDDEWFECAPGGSELVHADWMNEVIGTGPMLADGRMFVELRSMEYGLIDPVKRQVLPLCQSTNVNSWGHCGSAYWRRPCFRPGEPVLLDTPEGRFLFDEDSTTLTRVYGETSEECIRGFPDGGVILVDGRGRLVRQDLGTDERTVLFPVPD